MSTNNDRSNDVRIPVLSGDVRIQIDPEKVNQIVAAAILSAGLGERVRRIADEFLTNEKTGYGEKGLKAAVLEEMNRLVLELLRSQEFSAHLRQRVRDHVTDELCDEYLKKLVEDKFRRGY